MLMRLGKKPWHWANRTIFVLVSDKRACRSVGNKYVRALLILQGLMSARTVTAMFATVETVMKVA
jgi:hypothetical protein